MDAGISGGGAGMAFKLARHAVGYAMMTAVHESMQLTQAAGNDQEALAHVLRETDVAGIAFHRAVRMPVEADSEG